MAAEMMEGAKAAKRKLSLPRRIEPLGFVVSSPTTVSLVAMLDMAQRVETLRKAVRQLNGYGFAFLYDGFIEPAPGERSEALLLVIGSAWGFWRAEAHPYTFTPVQGHTFRDLIDVPGAAIHYHPVFD